MPSPSARPGPVPSIGVLIAVSMLQPIGINMFIPSIPGMRIAFATDATTIQLTISLYLLSTAFAMLVLGPMSDRYGRRPVMLCGLVLFVAGSVLASFASTIGVLLLARVIQAIGGSAGIALSRAVVRDVYDRERSASMIGYVSMGMAVAPMVAPAIGGAFDEQFGWRASFFAMTAFGVLVLVYAGIRLPETRPTSTGTDDFRSLLRGFGTLMRLRTFWIYAGTMTIASVVFFAFIGGAPHAATQLMHLSPKTYGIYFALVAIGYIFGNFISGRYAMRIGIRRMILAGNFLSMIGVVTLAAFAAADVLHPLAFFGTFLLSSAGNGMALPSIIAGAVSVRPELAGAASGLLGSLQVGMGAAATTLVGVLFDIGLMPGTAWFVVLPMLIAGIAAYALAWATPRN